MFERYTEKARRVIFFARYECSTLGSPMIGSEHLLLGLLRETPGIVTRYLKIDSSELTMRLMEIRAPGERLPTSVDLPLDDSSKRILGYAAEEAQRLGQTFIGPEHLLLGMMREDRAEAAEVLRALGAPGLAEVRRAIGESGLEDVRGANRGAGAGSYSPSLRMVEEGSQKELRAHLPLQAVPGLGETILLAIPGEDGGRYKVVDVRWEFRGQPHEQDTRLSGVEIVLRREDSTTT